MKRFEPRRITLAAALMLGAASLSLPAAADTAAQDLTDARQETQIWTTYALSPYLRANDIKVSVHQGTATLTGVVEEHVNKELARQIALGVSGIREVDNRIMVQSDFHASAPTAVRSYGEVIDDATLVSAVKSKLLWSRYTDGLSTEVESARGKVTLKGTADTAAAKALAGRLALNTRGVSAVDNQLVVSGGKPALGAEITAGAQTAGSEVSDAWITTKVKSTYLYSINVDGSDISVKTSAGVVSLSGKVDSGAERALAIELASNIRGVKSVSATGLKL